MHSRNVVHGTLCPSYVILSPEGVVKLSEIYTGYLFASEGLAPLSGNFYASTGSFGSEPRDFRDDVFSVGCIAYELISGRHPYGMSASEAKKCNVQPPALRNIPARQWRAIEGAIRLHRGDRTMSVEKFWSDYSRGARTNIFSRILRASHHR